MDNRDRMRSLASRVTMQQSFTTSYCHLSRHVNGPASPQARSNDALKRRTNRANNHYSLKRTYHGTAHILQKNSHSQNQNEVWREVRSNQAHKNQPTTKEKEVVSYRPTSSGRKSTSTSAPSVSLACIPVRVAIRLIGIRSDKRL